MSNFLIALCVGGMSALVALKHEPAIAKIIEVVGGNAPMKFVVICQADNAGQVNCTIKDIQDD